MKEPVADVVRRNLEDVWTKIHEDVLGEETMKHRETKQTFDTGAQRDDAVLKGRPSLIPAVATYRKAIHLEKGAEHYGDRNWEKGMPLSRVIDSAIRHLIQFTDGDTSEDHLAAAACNVDFLIYFQEAIRAGELPIDLDDRPALSNKKVLESFLTRIEADAKVNRQPTIEVIGKLGKNDRVEFKGGKFDDRT